MPELSPVRPLGRKFLMPCRNDEDWIEFKKSMGLGRLFRLKDGIVVPESPLLEVVEA